jgi:hypothetical protein
MIQPEQVAQVMEDLKPYFALVIEGQLKDYGENANSGCWVSFRLPAPEDLEIFRGQDRSGRNARQGKRYTLMLVELGDDETAVNQEARGRMGQQEARPRKLSQIAGGICHDAKFRAWVEQTYAVPCENPEQAAEFIRSMSGVESRAHLDTNTEAAGIFRAILADYDKAKQD